MVVNSAERRRRHIVVVYKFEASPEMVSACDLHVISKRWFQQQKEMMRSYCKKYTYFGVRII